MKVIVKFYNAWGSAVTKGFNLENTATVDELKEII